MAIHAYLRVSTTAHDQTTENQKKAIQDAGFAVDVWHAEDGVSGTIAALERPTFAAMMAQAKEGDTCICTMVDRLGRNASDILHTIEEFKRLGIRLCVLQFAGVDVTSAMGKMIVTVMAAMAEMERNMLVERTRDGLARTKAEGTILGRPMRIKPATMKDICEKYGDGSHTLQQLKDLYKVPRNTILKNYKKWKDDLAGYEAEYEKRSKQYKLNKDKKK